MTTYRDVQGYRIRKVDSDPDNAKVGQVWYNNITKQIKVRGFRSAAWSSGGNLNNIRFQGGYAGTQTAALYAGGYDIFSGAEANSEEYNGTSWTEGNNINSARWSAYGGGTQTAAFIAGGFNPTKSGFEHGETEEYSGTSWTESGDLNTKRSDGDGFGTQTAGVLAGGGGYGQSPSGPFANVEHFNGSSWTNATAFPAVNQYGMGTGTQTAGLFCGGQSGPTAAVTTTLEYNGSSWTAGGALGTAKKRAALCGTQTAGFVFSGATGPGTSVSPVAQEYDGSTWSNQPAELTTNNYEKKGVGTTSAALGFAGYFTTATEEFLAEETSTKTIDVS